MELHIPPRCPLGSKVLSRTDNQCRVPIKVTRKYEEPPTEHTYYLVPEFVVPTDVTNALVEAGNPDATAWALRGDESMNPFRAGPALYK